MGSHSILSRSWELLAETARDPEQKSDESSGQTEFWHTRADIDASHGKVSMLSSKRTGFRVYVAEMDCPAIFTVWCVRAPPEGLATVALQALSQTLLELGSDHYRTPGLMQAVSFKSLTQIEPISCCPSSLAFSMLSISHEGFLDMIPVLGDTLLFPDWESVKNVELPVPRRNMFDSIVNCFLDRILHQNTQGVNEPTWDDIKELHSDMFRAENMALIVCGHVNTAAVIDAVDILDAKYAKKSPAFNSQTTTSNTSVYLRVSEYFASTATSSSSSSQSFRLLELPEPPLLQAISPAGTKHVRSDISPFAQAWHWAGTVVCMIWPVAASTDPLDQLCIRSVWRYLVEGSSAPLRLAVANDSMFWNGSECRHDEFIEHHFVDGPPSFHGILVKVESSNVEHVLVETLLRAVNDAWAAINMNRIKKVLRNERLKLLDMMEESVAPKLSSDLMQAFLNSTDQSVNEADNLRFSLEETLGRFEALPSDDTQESLEFWRNTFRNILLQVTPACLNLSPWISGRSNDTLQSSAALTALAAMTASEPIFDPRAALDDAKLVTSMLVEPSPPQPLAGVRRLDTAASRRYASTHDTLDPDWLQSAAISDVTTIDSAVPQQMFQELPSEASSVIQSIDMLVSRSPQEEDQQILPQVQRPSTLGRLPPSNSIERFPVASLQDQLSCACVSVTSYGERTHVASCGCVSAGLSESVLEHLTSKGLSSAEEALPFVIQFDHIRSSFVEVSLWLDTTDMPDELRPYLELFLEIVFSSPVVSETGTRYSVEDLTYSIRQDLIQYSTSIGTSASNFICGAWAQCACITVKAEKSKYALAVAWLHRLLYLSDFDLSSLKLAATKLLTDAHDRKRDSLSIAYALTSILNYDGSSNHSATNFISQLTFLGGVLQKLNTVPAVVVSALNQLKSYLTLTEKLRARVTCNVFEQMEPIRPWRVFAAHARAPFRIANGPVTESRTLRSDVSRSPEGKFLVVDCGTDIECCVCVTIPLDIGYQSKALPILLATMEYLATPEGELNGFLQRTVGGDCPLLRCHPEQGIIFLTLFGTRDVVAALETTKTVLQVLGSGRLPINKHLLEDVIHTLLVEVVERGASPMRAGLQCFYDLLRGVDHSYNVTFAKQLREVSSEDVRQCICHTMSRLFSPKSAVVICCAGGLAVPIRRGAQSRAGTRKVELLTLKDCIQRAVLPFEATDETASTASSDANSSQSNEPTSRKSGWGLGGYYDAFWRTARTQPLQLVALSAAVATASVALLIANKKS